MQWLVSSTFSIVSILNSSTSSPLKRTSNCETFCWRSCRQTSLSDDSSRTFANQTALGQALTDEGLDQVAADIGQSEVASLESIGQLGVLDAELVEQGGVKVVDVYRVFVDAPADFV